MAKKTKIRADLKATRLAFHKLAREIPESVWGEKGIDSAWTVKEEMWHIAWGMRFILDLIKNSRHGIGLPNPPMFIADRLNAVYSWLRAIFATPHSILRRFDTTHAAVLKVLETVHENEWETSVKIFGKAQTVEALFYGIPHHFEEHAARIRPLLTERF